LIYICIPTHNEQQTVGVVLWKLRQVLTEFHRDYQLLVADDASTDKTPDVLEPYTRVLPLTVIRSERQLGHAASLEMLLREAARRSEYPKRDIIVTLQADFSEEPDDVVPMIKRIEAGADLVLGNKVSVTRPTRLRRLARALGTFFTRAQQWPEGVTTPFDGFRAYRLYGVKRALEDAAGRRLVRYDGWAGNAELLRTVLPHARRVEVLDVEDRADRLQRPRRERPFAAALRVRPMIRGVVPQGLATVEELDRLAATASTSRDGTARRTAPDRPALQEEGRANGRSRHRGEGARLNDVRERGPARGARDASRASGRGAQPKVRREQTARTTPASPEAVLEHAPDLALVGEPAAPDTPPRPKKRRRRRRRGPGGSTTAPQQAGAPEQLNGPDAGAVAGLAAETGPEDGVPGVTASERGGTDQGNTEARERKRRRRRGGRGRRRGARAAGADANAAVEEAVEKNDQIDPEQVSPSGSEPAPE
jgi:hypothetical protein